MTAEDIAEWEEQVAQAVKQGDYEMAESMPTLRARKALLDSILEPEYNSEIRVGAQGFECQRALCVAWLSYDSCR